MGAKNKIKFEKAVRLRERGYSLKEVSKKIEISKSTASLWLRNVSMTKEGVARLAGLSVAGAEKAKLTKKNKKDRLLHKLNKDAEWTVSGIKFHKKNLRLFLALLYWCEGSKTERRVVFMNSDPKMIKIFMFLIRGAYKLEEDKFSAFLHLHDYHNRREMINFWSDLTGIDKERISVYNKKHTGTRKKEGYKGCLSIRYGDVRILDEIFLIIDKLLKKIG
jgi:transposase